MKKRFTLTEVYLIKESVPQRALVNSLAQAMDELQDARDMALMLNNRGLSDRIYITIQELSGFQKEYSEMDIRDKEFVEREKEEKAAEQEAGLDDLENTLLSYGMPNNTSVEDAVQALMDDGHIDPNNATHVMRAEEAAQVVFDEEEEIEY